MLSTWQGVVHTVEAASPEQEAGESAAPAESPAESSAVPGERPGPLHSGPLPSGPQQPARRITARFRGVACSAWWRRARLPLITAAVAGVTCLLYVAYLKQASSLGTDSDGASNVLQAWDMLHGNPLLRGWQLSDVSFYTTELPEYALVELLRGLNAGVIPAAAAATYALLVLLAALLAKGRATGAEAVVRALIAAGIMLAPETPAGAGIVLSSPDHVGTAVPLLLTWLAIDRLAGRGYLPWLVGVLLTLVEIADESAVYVGAVPVIIVSAVRIYQRRASWRIDAGLLVAAAASVALASAVLLRIRHAGGFVVAPAKTSFTTAAQMPHNVWTTVESVLQLFGADFFGMRFGLPAAIALLHLVGLIMAAFGCWLGARQLVHARDRLVPILVVGVAVNLAAYLFSTQVIDLASARLIAAVLPFSAVLAGRLIPGRPATTTLLPALLAVLLAYTAVIGYNASKPAQPPATQDVASWLLANHLTAGIGDYWAANITTVADGGRVRVRSVVTSCGRFVPDAWESNESWYERPNTATFLVLALTSPAGADGSPGEAKAQFGVPQRTARIGAYEVLVWNHDLLPAVTTGFGRGCGPLWQR
jgi:hypothetical protein